MNVESLWENFLEKIKSRISSLSYETWFKTTKLVSLDNNIAKVLVDLPIQKKQLQEVWYKTIVEVFSEITNTSFDFEFVLEDEMELTNNIPVENIGVPINTPEKSNLNSKYTFDSFIVGDSNRFAYMAAVSVAQNPGKAYNPLFIYGSSGLGKTHLMHAIGNFIIENSNKKVIYVTSEQFISDFLNMNKKDENGTNFNYIDIFKNKYRKVDVLIIDDIQFLGGATQTQQEFFNTFNDLYDDNKQIIISSDRSPDDLKKLEDRLRTRFNWGLSVNIYPPDYEMRIEILKKKIIGQNMTGTISDDVVAYIANNCDSDVRQLEGALTRVIAYATMFNTQDIDLNLAIDALKDYLSKASFTKNNIQKIQQVVAEYYNITVEDLKSKKRKASIAFPRQIAIYLCRTLTNESFPKIGIQFGGRDHSTVMHSVDKIENELKTNPQFKNILENLKSKI
ncbi:MAG: chromosomal replication initiator protein DnaA [Tenericutes bacterium]|nr:chromosomal replication initiator protein DnaA [Mycoplasmatota bacterium]